MRVTVFIPNATSTGQPSNTNMSKPGGTLEDAFEYIKEWHSRLKPGTKITIEV